MQRGKSINDNETSESSITVSSKLLEEIFKYENGSDILGLLMFYCNVSAWQNTNQVKATDSYCRKGLRYGKDKFYEAKKVLMKMGLIQKIQRKTARNTFGETFIKLNLDSRSSRWGSPVVNKGSQNNGSHRKPQRKIIDGAWCIFDKKHGCWVNEATGDMV